MSYCRWSSDDFQCDVYIYESCYGGFDIHVAGKKYVFKEPLPPYVDINDFEKWWERYEIVQEMVEKADLIDIGLPYDGESFNEQSIDDVLKLIKELRAVGYRIPDYVFKELEGERSANVPNMDRTVD